jgi:hypothetical protein
MPAIALLLFAILVPAPNFGQCVANMRGRDIPQPQKTRAARRCADGRRVVA